MVKAQLTGPIRPTSVFTEWQTFLFPCCGLYFSAKSQHRAGRHARALQLIPSS